MTNHTEIQIPDTHELAVRIFYEEFGMDAPRNKAVNAIERAIIMERKRQSSATTTEMQIPDDVMEAARECLCGLKCFPPSDFDATVIGVASAILAERERCASIVENIYLMSDYGDEARKKSRFEIASIIRNC